MSYGAGNAQIETLLPQSLENQPKEPLFYDPSSPTDAVMFDSLPRSPQLDTTGNNKPSGLVSALLILVVPFLSVFGHGTYVFLHYLAAN